MTLKRKRNYKMVKDGNRYVARAKKTKKFVKRGKKKFNGVFSASEKGIVFISKNRLPMPQKMVTKFTVSNNGYWTSGNLNNGYGIVKLNDPLAPLASLNSALGFANPRKTLTVLNPTLWSTLVSAELYTNGNVISSAIKFRILPTDPKDVVHLCIVPNPPNTTFSFADYYQVTQFPWSKYGVFNSADDKTWVTNAIRCSDLYGKPKDITSYDVSGQYNFTYTTNPAQLCYWYLLYEVPAYGQAANFVNNIAWEVEVEYVVELYNPAINNYPVT